MGKPKRKRAKKQDHLILNLLILVTVVLVVFEGRLVVTMFTYRSVTNASPVTAQSGTSASSTGSMTESQQTENASTTNGSSSMEASLAGLPGNLSIPEGSDHSTTSAPSSNAVVPKASTPVDDSYFSDAVFIGDSRMEGFRNASGITQGRFFTSVGMSLSSMRSENIIQTPDGNITVAAALSGGTYNKIYIMLGTNDLGEYDWSSFQDGFVSAVKRFQEIQPGALIYICSVIYVEESKVDSTQYVNNANVDKINSILLDICEEQGYHYLNLNEFLSNGYGALIDGASSDGVHIYPDYCKQMLDYLKSHYIPVNQPDDTSSDETEATTDADDSV